MPASAGDLDVAAALELLRVGELEVQGRLLDASNLAVLAWVHADGVRARVMYKPVAGERPLWDFPEGTLAAREVAAFAVSDAGGWDLVPPTVLRDGPFGPGSVQLWVEELGQPDGVDGVVGGAEMADGAGHRGPAARLIDVIAPAQLTAGWLPVFEGQLPDGTAVVVAHADRPDLASAAVFDVVINNADRKGSHLVIDTAGALRGFDHGVSFHEQPKLRTVLWGWVGKPLPDADLARLDRLAGWLASPTADLPRALEPLLTAREVRAIRRRVSALLDSGHFPQPSSRWPAVPWPPL